MADWKYTETAGQVLNSKEGEDSIINGMLSQLNVNQNVYAQVNYFLERVFEIESPEKGAKKINIHFREPQKLGRVNFFTCSRLM